jgi:short-subunit dehydrogenase
MSRRPPLSELGNCVAAITGAGSGIGRALAQELAGRGAHLALADIDEAGLAETASRCAGHGSKVTTQTVDVADRAAVTGWADQVVAEHGRVELVVNNAGVAIAATVEAMAYEDLDWLMGINFWGVVHGTKAFLPHLLRADRGHIVNISSVFGLVAIPTQSAYNASKFAVRGFTDALRLELDIAGRGVSCTTVHPGGVKTAIAQRARVDASVAAISGVDPEQARLRFDKILLTRPERAARRILRAVTRDQRRVLVGPDAVVLDLLSRLPAGVTQRLIVAGARRR